MERSGHLPRFGSVVWTAEHLGQHPAPCNEVGKEIVWPKKRKLSYYNHRYLLKISPSSTSAHT